MKLAEVQDRLFDLLCLIDDICRREGVTYFLDGGTEIGSVREKDIIAWDDDADIKLKWSDYPAFKDAMEKHLPEYIRLVELKNAGKAAERDANLLELTTELLNVRYFRRAARTSLRREVSRPTCSTVRSSYAPSVPSPMPTASPADESRSMSLFAHAGTSAKEATPAVCSSSGRQRESSTSASTRLIVFFARSI